MTEFWAAIVGVLAGGLVILLVQMLIFLVAARERRAQALSRRKAIAHALVFKITRIHSHLNAFNKHVKSSFERATSDGRGHLPPWQIVLPLVTMPERVHFSADEMGMLLGLGDGKLFNQIVAMDEFHNSTIDVFQLVSGRRLELTSMMAVTGIAGDVGAVDLTLEQLRAFAPRMLELNSMIEALRPACEEDEKAARQVLTRLQQVLRSKLGMPYKVTADLPGQIPQKARPSEPLPIKLGKAAAA